MKHNNNLTAMQTTPARVDDILLKFVDPNVHNIEHKKHQYITKKDEFRKYMQNMAKNNINNMSPQQQLNEDKLAIISSNLQPNNIAQNTNNKTIHSSNNSNNSNNNSNGSDTINNAYTTNPQSSSKYIRIRRRYLNIDSRDRDLTLYPDANSYTLDVSKESFSNIAKIELVSTHFLNVQQLIRNQPVSLKNNVIKWNIEDDVVNGQFVTYSAEIDPGNYTAEELAKEIENKMNAVPRINGESQYFTVSINTLGDVVSISSINFKPIPTNPFNYPAISLDRIYVTAPNHGLEVGDKVWIIGSEDVGDGAYLSGKIPSRYINLYHPVTLIIDENTFEFLYLWPGTLGATALTDQGGNNVSIGVGVNFRLLFSLPMNIADVIGFPEEDTDFAETQFNIDITPINFISYIIPYQNNSLSLIVTNTPHGLTTNDRILIFGSVPPGSTNVNVYDHTYGGETALNDENEALRLDYVAKLSTGNGWYITVIDNTSFTIPLPYGDYQIDRFNPSTGDNYYISEWIFFSFVGEPGLPFGPVILNTAPELIFTGEPYFYITSNLIGGDFSTATATINDVVNVFAKIYMAGDSNDDVYNSFVGGKKTFYNSVYTYLEKLDLKFQYRDGTLVDFLNTEHSLVLKITEVIQKVEGSEFNSKIGLYEYTSSKNLINPPSYYAKF